MSDWPEKVTCEIHENAVCYREQSDEGRGRWVCPACEIEALKRAVRVLSERTERLA